MDPEEPEVCQLFLKFSQKLVDLIGFRCGVDHTAVSVGLLEDFTSDMCAEHGSQLYGAFTLDTLRGYVTSTIPSEFLPDFLK